MIKTWMGEPRNSFILEHSVEVEEGLLRRLLQTLLGMKRLLRRFPKQRWGCADKKQHKKSDDGECDHESHEKVCHPSCPLAWVDPQVENQDAELDEADGDDVEQTRRQIRFQHRFEIFGWNCGRFGQF